MTKPSRWLLGPVRGMLAAVSIFSLIFSGTASAAAEPEAAPETQATPQIETETAAKTKAADPPRTESPAETVTAEMASRFALWVTEFKREAVKRGVRATTVERAFEGIALVERVIQLDRKQPEFTQTFWGYVDRRVSDKRAKRGAELLVQHKDLLDRIHKKYGVQPRFLVAFWGMETNFGDYTGKMPVIASLATLAFDRRRARFFREQLIAALQLMDNGHIPIDAQGSWAGAMGQAQFIPTTYRGFAVDGDGDKRSDMWESLADVFASASNYLSKSGWDGKRTWGREVSLPRNFDLELAGQRIRKPLAEWQRLGVRRFDGRNLPEVAVGASLILPAGRKGPAFLVYQNFRTILVWNRSVLYAIAVGHLADRIVGRPRFLTSRPLVDKPLSRDNILEIQRRLMDAGLYLGKVDGIAGTGTRRAVKAFQRSARLPPDGHLDLSLLEALRRPRVQ